MNLKQEKAKKICYKKPILRKLNYDYMCEKAWEMLEECQALQWLDGADEEVLLEAFDDDDEQLFEFRMLFSTLSVDCEKFIEDLKEFGVPDHFDDFVCFSADGNEFGGMMGYESIEGDYFGIEPFMYPWCDEATQKRLERLTKVEILETAKNCFKVMTAFLSISSRYEDLKDAFDILKGKQLNFLGTIKEIEKLYESANYENFCGKATWTFDRLVIELPQEIWVQC